MANPFVKKTWQNRLSEYPTRRQLVDISTGNTQIVDVTRNEGQIYNTGDGFTQVNMNDLEQRIYDAFNGGTTIKNIPRAVPRNVTDLYQAGTLWDSNQDVRVGDYFQLSRLISSPFARENDPMLQEDTDREFTFGSSWVAIAQVITPPEINTAYSHAQSYICVPCTGPRYDKIQLGNFGRCALDFTRMPMPYLEDYAYNIVSQIGQNTNPSSEGSIAADATISDQLRAEFGRHLDYFPNVPFSNSLDSNGNVNGYSVRHATFLPLTDIDIFGHTLFTGESNTGSQFERGNRQLSFFRNLYDVDTKVWQSNTQIAEEVYYSLPTFLRIVGNNANVYAYQESAKTHLTLPELYNRFHVRQFIPITGKFIIHS